MIQYVIYFLIAIGATTAGSMTGMGGGVIIKPLMDVLHDFDVETIGIMSSLTVFVMSLVSVGKQMTAGNKIPFRIAVPLAAGSVAGGYIGQTLLEKIVTMLNVQNRVLAVQNIVLSILILGVLCYMKNKQRIKGKECSGILVSLLVGCFLGVCSSFLGIGGGPINVALIIYLYSMSTKTAAACSLVTILFAQVSKLLTAAFSTGFGNLDVPVVLFMCVGAVAGGFIGTNFSKRFTEKGIDRAFNAVQLLVLGVTIFNVIRNI